MIESQQVLNTKKVYQLVLPSKIGCSPHLYMNPYTLLSELNKQVKGKYDMQFIHVKYYMTKSEQQKRLNQIYTDDKIFEIDTNTNNIFSVNFGQAANKFMLEHILKDAEKLKPPMDYSPSDYQKAIQSQLQDQQMKRLNSIKKKIEAVMGFYNDKKQFQEVQTIKSIQSFKLLYNKQYFKSGDFRVLAKAIMNKPVFQRLRSDSQAKDGRTEMVIKTRQGKQAKVYLNPNNESANSFQIVNDQYRINNWSLNALLDESFTCYFGTDELKQKMSKVNRSVNFTSSISFVQRQNRTISLSIMTFLWNQTIMKITVNLAQIKKIQRCVNNNQYEYYFYLTYPPLYYITQMKQDQANTQRFIKFSDRVTNFAFLDNQKISQNIYLRYYLFNNSILRVNIVLNDQLLGGAYLPVTKTHQKLQRLCQVFKGTIQIQPNLKSFYKIRYKLKSLSNKMNFNELKNLTMQQLTKQNQDKLWVIKYLILVMIRYNYIIPTSDQVGTIIKCIEGDKNLDCYLYVLWRTATNMWGYQNQKLKFVEYFKKQAEQVKKMNLKDIMKRILNASDSIVYIFRASLTPSGILFNPPTPQMKGRLLKQYANYSQFFIRVSLCEQNQVQLKNQKYITKMYFRKYMKQIQLFDRIYDPLGWSPSQLRSFSLWYFHGISGRKYENQELPQLRRRHILNFLGDFNQIQNPAKKAARIGQSFSSSWTYYAKDIQHEQIDDIYSSENVNFTDGIGKISQALLEDISLKLKIKDLTVIQIRYLGAKGVLVLDQTLPKNKILLRKSMIKYPCQAKNAAQYLDILDWNKYKAGFLNRQIIILLRTLGIQNVVFSTVQDEHIKNIEKMTFKDCSIFKYMGEDLNTQINNLEPANKIILSLLNAGFQLQKQPFFRGLLQTLKKNGYYQLKVKSNIRIQKSARIIGIVDEDGILQENEVYCSIHDSLSLDYEQKKQVVQGAAIITRNPCLHPADIRVVTCIGKKQAQQRFAKIGKQNKFNELWNVVIMPIKGKYPLTSQISGSDLDGDNFFICWDDRLIPKQVHQAVLIDQPPASKPANNKTQAKAPKNYTEDDNYSRMLDFFIDYTNYQKLGQIDNSHLVHADLDLVNYANNKICLKLAQIHGKAVDFPKTGYCPPVSPDLFCSEYPDFMQKQNANSYISQSILGKLYRDIKNKISTLLQKQVYDNVNQIDTTLIYDFEFNQQFEEIKQCIQVLRQYERQVTNLISLLGVDTQYEIYSGNFSAVKKNLKIFGKNRLISSILALRQRFFNLFFKNLPDDATLYKQTGHQEKHMNYAKYFSDEARRKAQIYYLTSYILKFPQIKETQGIKKLKQTIEQVFEKLKIMNKQQKYCGFVWFIIPKLILNLKVSWSKRNGQKQNQGQGQKEKEIKQEDQQEYM